MIKRVGILVGLFLIFMFGVVYAEEPICGNEVCEEGEKECVPSHCDGDVCTLDCGSIYCPRDCQGSVNELDKCVKGCKAQHGNEEDRSPCIKSCKHRYGDKLECVQCGDGCISKEMSMVAMCLPPTKEFECGSRGGKCVILNNEIFEGYEDEELEIDPGTNPDDAFYFLDKFFDSFGDELEVREERVAEIKAMVEAGNIEAAKEALEEYSKLAEKIKHEVSPDERERAVRSAAAIRNVMEEIEEEIPEEEKDKFLGVVDDEVEVAAAAEIATKINDLCRELSDISPELFYDNCKVDDEDPKWQKKMYKELTKEQKEEAKKFAKIMKQCFKTSGQDCSCEEIPYDDFSDACSEASSLATECEINGDERACEKLDDIDMPELPDHLQEIFDDLEDINIKKYEMHMPKECQEAGVTSPKECGKIMIEIHSPEECKQPLLDSGCDSESECREICDKIMDELHTPKECAEQGLTGYECEEYMDNYRGPGGPRIDFNCQEIVDPMERLDCYDKAASQAEGFGGMSDDYEGNCMTDSDWKAKKEECRNMYGQHAGDEPIYGDSGQGWECVVDAKCVDFSQGGMGFDDIKEKERQCADSCESKGGHWDFSYGECKCYIDDFGPGPGESDGGPGCDDCSSQCPGSSGTDCINNRCECYYEDDEPVEDDNGETSQEERGSEENGESGVEESSGSEESSEKSSGGESSSEESSESSDDPGEDNSGGEESGSNEVTGEVVRDVPGSNFLLNLINFLFS